MKKEFKFSQKNQEINNEEVIKRTITEAHLLFEQSGTFKHEFQKLGISAKDYDIENQFGETDVIIDLFKEIEKAKNNESSNFDNFKPSDIIVAFFPCTYFSGQNNLLLSAQAYQMRNWSEQKKEEYITNRLRIREEFLDYLNDLIQVCENRGLCLIIENPYQNSYLIKSGEIKEPDLLIKDRRLDGDWFKKPTAFWFFNCSPHHNELDEADVLKPVESKTISSTHSIERSLMHPQFARRFIKRYIL